MTEDEYIIRGYMQSLKHAYTILKDITAEINPLLDTGDFRALRSGIYKHLKKHFDHDMII